MFDKCELKHCDLNNLNEMLPDFRVGLLGFACMLSLFSHVWIFVTLWTVNRQAPLSIGFSRQESWSEFPCPPLGDLPDPSLMSPTLAGWDFPGGSDGEECSCNVGDLDSIPGLERSPGGGHGHPLQYSCLENPHWQRSLAGYSPWDHKELDTTEQLRTVQHMTKLQPTSYSRIKNWKHFL